MFFGRVFQSDLKFSLSRTRILFWYARESTSRIFLSSVLCTYIELWGQQLVRSNMFSTHVML